VGDTGAMERRVRMTKDEITNTEGRKLVNWMGENGLSIFNGSMKGDEEGEFTFTGGKGNTTIDFVMGDEDAREEVASLTVGLRSETHSLVCFGDFSGEYQCEYVCLRVSSVSERYFV